MSWNGLGELPLAFVAALGLDLCFGDPPNALHPVAWLGRIISPLRRRGGSLPAGVELVVGGFTALLIPLGYAGAGVGMLALSSETPWLHFAVMVFLLKSTFAVRGLGRAAFQVREALSFGDLSTARGHLSALCSRDPTHLGPAEISQGTIESVAENASDSAVAPFFYLALFGLPGALFYRAVNTLDAMLGYRGRFEYLGKASARLDDLLNWIPARLSAGLMLMVGQTMGLDARRAWSILRRDASHTVSPNAGHPMATMAGLLGIRLEKAGEYRLGDARRRVEFSDIDRAWMIARAAMLVAAVLAGLGGWWLAR